MASLGWYLVIFKLLVPTWSSLFISLRPEGRLYISQLLYLANEESEPESSLEESLLESQFFSEALERIVLIFLSSRHKPDFLAMI